jgi:hypothetical protein
MYLSAERIAVANKAVQDTFEQTSIAWQAIPHWDTGDPGQLRVRVEHTYQKPGSIKEGVAIPFLGESVELSAESVRFAVTVAQATAPTPDALLDAVIARTVTLAAQLDGTVIPELIDAETTKSSPGTVPLLLDALIDARAAVEKAGYRAPSCLLTDTAGLKALNQLQSGIFDLQSLLDAANINSLYRVDSWGKGKAKGKGQGKEEGQAKDEGQGKEEGQAKDEGQVKDENKAYDEKKGRLLLLGRRQRVAHGGAAAASPGEEPADLAVSVPPSLEIVGETNDGNIELAVRIRFAPRLTNKYGIASVVIS